MPKVETSVFVEFNKINTPYKVCKIYEKKNINLGADKIIKLV